MATQLSAYPWAPARKSGWTGLEDPGGGGGGPGAGKDSGRGGPGKAREDPGRGRPGGRTRARKQGGRTFVWEGGRTLVRSYGPASFLKNAPLYDRSLRLFFFWGGSVRSYGWGRFSGQVLVFCFPDIYALHRWGSRTPRPPRGARTRGKDPGGRGRTRGGEARGGGPGGRAVRLPPHSRRRECPGSPLGKAGGRAGEGGIRN